MLFRQAKCRRICMQQACVHDPLDTRFEPPHHVLVLRFRCPTSLPEINNRWSMPFNPSTNDAGRVIKLLCLDAKIGCFLR